MKKTAYISVVFLLGLLFVACSGEEVIPEASYDKLVEIAFGVDHYAKVVTTAKSASASITRATAEEIAAAENKIDDLYLFLFPTATGQSLKKYYIAKSGDTWTVTEIGGSAAGSYSEDNKKVSLNLTQAEAGPREVYIVANYGAGLNPNIATIDDLKAVSRSTDTPWSTTLATPLLMSGNKTHNFIDNPMLGSGGVNTPVALTRALAKVELNIRLKKEHQSKPRIEQGTIGGGNWVPQYHYALLNFEKETYLLKDNAKTNNNLANQTADPVVLKGLDPVLWKEWVTGDDNMITSYQTDSESGKVTSMRLVTYLNERISAVPRSFIGISMPYEGAMPPPEFGPDLTGIYLPQIERNYWYVYDIEI